MNTPLSTRFTQTEIDKYVPNVDNKLDDIFLNDLTADSDGASDTVITTAKCSTTCFSWAGKNSPFYSFYKIGYWIKKLNFKILVYLSWKREKTLWNLEVLSGGGYWLVAV